MNTVDNFSGNPQFPKPLDLESKFPFNRTSTRKGE